MDQSLVELAGRIAAALERLAPPPLAAVDLASADAFVWHPSPPHLAPVAKVSRVDIALLQGVERQKQILLDNTLRFDHRPYRECVVRRDAIAGACLDCRHP